MLRPAVIIASAALAAAAVSCSNDNLVGGKGEARNETITFRTEQRNWNSSSMDGESTRAELVTTESLASLYGSFSVTAFPAGTATAPYFTDEASQKSAEWATAIPHYWPKNSSLDFYACAPAANPGVSDLDYTGGQTSFSYALPAGGAKSGDDFTDASAQKDLLFAITKGYGRTTAMGTVPLNFDHALSAILFKTGTCDDGVIKSIALKGVRSSGSAVYSGSAYTWSFPEGTSFGTYTQSFNVTVSSDRENEEITLSGDPAGSRTFMMIPQPLGENAEIEVIFQDSATGEDLRLRASLKDSEWKWGKAYTYRLSIHNGEISVEGKIISWNEGIDIPVPMKDGDYTFTVDKDTLIFLNTDAALANKLKIASYMKTAPTASAAAVTYRAEYSLDGGQTWIKYNDIETGISGFTPYHNAGYTTATDVTLTASSRSGIELSKFRWVDDATVADNWDLSKCGIGGEGYSASNPQNTANTYIVKHPGTYRFPCVYGNSVKNGNPTDEGYRSQAEGQTVLGTFINSSGQEIQNSYILKDLSLSPSVMPTHPRAAILWGDAKDANGHLLINNVTLNYDPSEPEDAYISFSTSDRESLVQGNVTIILYDDKNDNQVYDPLDLSLKSQNTSSYSTTAELLEKDIVLWGWQIWVTDASLGPDNIGETGEDGGSYGHYFFMSRNLGWVDGTVFNFIVPERLAEFQIRLTQDKSGLSEVITVLQPAVSIFVGGHGAAYQYGRNIPFFNTECSSNTEVMRINEAGDDIAFMKLAGVTKSDAIFPNITPKTFDNAVTIIANDIRRPEIFNAYQGMDYYFTNLLARDNSSVNTYAQEKKTIYDPSPYGYVIPNPNAFASLKGYTGVTYSGNRNSVIFNDNPNLIFPNTGWRIYNGTLTNWNSSYYFTNSIPTSPSSMICIQMLSPTQFGPHTTGNKNYATAVRPVLENAPSK